MYFSLLVLCLLWLFLLVGSENYWDIVFRVLLLVCSIFVLVLSSMKDMIWNKNSLELCLSKWFEGGLLSEKWVFFIDSLVILMLLLVSGVSLLVHIFSVDYMGDASKFLLYINIFTVLMMILVLGGNILVLFVGWEGVGLCSFLLITFWNKRISSSKSGIQAMIFNRIGDLGLVLGMLLGLENVWSVDMGSMNLLVDLDMNIGVLVGFCILLGGIGKSAQIGLHVWLPNAMEGPTPVSALIHAATMVTSGIYILGRCNILVEENIDLMNGVRFVGCLSLLFSGLIGLSQNDIKKVVAYSTGSQLGYMIVCCGLSSYSVGIFHMLNHGSFKAALFLGSGSIIHGLSDIQDMRRMGGLLGLFPISYIVMLIGSISLMGIPFMTGFYSKDLILEIAFLENKKVDYIICVLGVVCTSGYSSRLLYLSFIGDIGSRKRDMELGRESIDLVSSVLSILCLGSIFLGFNLRDITVEMGSDVILSTRLESRDIITECELGLLWIKFIPLVFCILGGYMGIFMNHSCSFSILEIRYLKILNRKFYFEKVYNEWIGSRVLNMGLIDLYFNIDKGILEMFGSWRVNRVLENVGFRDMVWNTGDINRGILVCLTLILLLFLL